MKEDNKPFAPSLNGWDEYSKAILSKINDVKSFATKKIQSAKQVADDALSTANNAQSMADNAQNSANNAYNRADNAYYMADSAQQTANNALYAACQSARTSDLDLIWHYFHEKIAENHFLSDIIRIDQREKKSCDKIIRGEVACAVVREIRRRSHIYLCKYDSENEVMNMAQLDDENSYIYADGTPANLDGSEGDAYMKLPEFWYKITEDIEDIIDIEFSLVTPNDTEGWNHWFGDELIAVHEAYAENGNNDTNGILRSISGVVSSGSISQENFKAKARNAGNGFSLVKWRHHCIMAILFYAYYGNTDSQLICGSGTLSFEKTMGDADYLGMKDTENSNNGNSHSIKFWGLENWWGNKWEWIDDVYGDGQGGVQIINNDGSYRTIKCFCDVSGVVTKMVFGSNGDLLPKAVDGYAYNQYGYADNAYVWNYFGCVAQRSYSGADTDGGVAYVDVYGSASNGYVSFGSRLAFKGTLNELAPSDFRAV